MFYWNEIYLEMDTTTRKKRDRESAEDNFDINNIKVDTQSHISDHNVKRDDEKKEKKRKKKHSKKEKKKKSDKDKKDKVKSKSKKHESDKTTSVDSTSSSSDSDDDTPRSIITGKKIKMNRNLSIEDKLLEIERAAKRHYMNTQY